jgi:hypothetical protein
LETVARMTREVSWSSDQASLLTRISRLRGLMLATKTTLGCDEASTVDGPCEEVAAVCRNKSGALKPSGDENRKKRSMAVRVNRTVLGELSQVERQWNFWCGQGVLLQEESCSDDSEEE